MAVSSSKRFKKVYVEISNVCNLQCSFCPAVERNESYMGQELFADVIRQVGPLTEEVCFHLMGEPLAHPQFSEFVELCGREGVRVNLTTNGTLLNTARTQALLHPTVSQVNLSIHSFEANFPGKDMKGYLRKIFQFTHEALLHRPDLFINYRLWDLKKGFGADESHQEVLGIIEKEFGVEFGSKTSRHVDVRWKKGLPVKGRFCLHFDSRFEWPHPAQPFRAAEGFCHGLGSHMGILADGTVVPCCLDKEGRIALGHCRKQSVAEILKAPRAQKMIKGFQSGRLVESLCQKCTFISRFDKKAEKLRQRSVNAADVVVPAEGL